MVAVKWFNECKQIPKTCIEEAYSTSDGLQECCVVFQAETHTKMVNVPQQTSLKNGSPQSRRCFVMNHTSGGYAPIAGQTTYMYFEYGTNWLRRNKKISASIGPLLTVW